MKPHGPVNLVADAARPGFLAVVIAVALVAARAPGRRRLLVAHVVVLRPLVLAALAALDDPSGPAVGVIRAVLVAAVVEGAFGEGVAALLDGGRLLLVAHMVVLRPLVPAALVALPVAVRILRAVPAAAGGRRDGGGRLLVAHVVVLRPLVLAALAALDDPSGPAVGVLRAVLVAAVVEGAFGKGAAALLNFDVVCWTSQGFLKMLASCCNQSVRFGILIVRRAIYAQ